MVMEIVKDDRNREMLQDKNEITQDNLILEDIQEQTQKTSSKCFYLTFLDKEIRVINNSCLDENDLIVYDNWEFETNLSLTDEDKETIISFCEEQDNQ